MRHVKLRLAELLGTPTDPHSKLWETLIGGSPLLLRAYIHASIPNALLAHYMTIYIYTHIHTHTSAFVAWKSPFLMAYPNHALNHVLLQLTANILDTIQKSYLGKRKIGNKTIHRPHSPWKQPSAKTPLGPSASIDFILTLLVQNPVFTNPRCSMYGIFTFVWVIFRANVGKCSIHGAYGNCHR